ncbi:MAG TPA: hypothetical protein VJ818_05800 [Actinomycetota bacterium]|nr:hypothetical protein [Actinomycetota bacterium]
MASILLVEDVPDLGLYEANILEREGHTVLRCSGGPSAFTACPLLKVGSCSVADAADLIIFSAGLFGPIRHRSYGGVNILRAYRSHPVYGRIPMLVVAYGVPKDLGGTGRLVYIEKRTDPEQILNAVDTLLESVNV